MTMNEFDKLPKREQWGWKLISALLGIVFGLFILRWYGLW
jgi:hypothetical protein